MTTYCARLRAALLTAALLVAVALPAATSAAELAGVRLPDRATVGGTELVLNGAGIRTRFFVNVYVAGLYVAERKTQPAELIAQAGPKRVAMTLLRELSAQTLVEALAEGMKANNGEADLAKLKPQIDALTATMLSIKEAKKGDTVALDFVPDAGTVVALNGKPLGQPIAGAELYRALLRVWLGDAPVDATLKRGLAGG